MNSANSNKIIAWDGYGLGPLPSGVAVYARRLADALRALEIEPFVVGGLPGCASSLHLRSLEKSETSSRYAANKIIHPMRALNLLSRSIPTDSKVVFHGLSNINLPILPSLRHHRIKPRYVLTVHDLIPLISPKSVSWTYFKQFEILLPMVLRKADRVICISNWTEKTLLERFPEFENKTSVILNGFDFDAEKTEEIAKTVNADQTKNGPIRLLAIGRGENYKRLNYVVGIANELKGAAYAEIVTNRSSAADLAVLGKSAIESGWLKIFSDVPNSELGSFYARADIYLQPSLYEGFCLPAVEATAYKLPVIYCGGSGIDEVMAYGIGHCLPAEAAIPDWTKVVVNTANLARSKFQGSMGTANSQMPPTWKDTATKVKSLYNDLLE